MEQQSETTQKARDGLTGPIALGILGVTPIGDIIFRGGWPGIGAGMLAATFVYFGGTPFIRAARGLPGMSHLLPEPKQIKTAASKRSVIDRLLNHFPEEQAQPKEVTQVDALGLEPMEDIAPNPLRLAGSLPRRSPTFAEMRHLIKPGMDILGYDGEQFIFAESLIQSVNMAAIGLPRSGKTVCLTFHAAQAIMRNAIVRGWDLHGDVVKDLGRFFHILDDVEEILADCQWLDSEIKRRSALRKRANAGDRRAIAEWGSTRELVYIVDEFLALMTRLKLRKAERELVANMVLLLIAEGAKFKMRIILTGQTMPAALFGESGSSAKDIISVKYAFQSTDRQAGMIGIEAEAIKSCLGLIVGPDSKGYAILDGGILLHAKLISIPYTTTNDIRQLLEEGYGSQDDEEDLMGYMVSGDGYEDEDRHTKTLPTQTRRHVATSAYDARRRQLAARRMPVRVQGTPGAQGRQSEGVYAKVPEMIIPEQKPEPTFEDALAVWNEVVRAGGKLSRYSLREHLVKRGFECGENKARDLLDKLKAKAEANQSVNR